MERQEWMKPNSESVAKMCEWLADNLQGMQTTLKQIMKLIEEDGNPSTYEMGDFDMKSPQLRTLVHEFNSMYVSLAERCGQITGEFQVNQCPELQMEIQGPLQPNSSKGSPYVAPGMRLHVCNLDRDHVDADRSLSCGDGNLETSMKESSRLLSDSESESFISGVNSYLGTVKQINGLGQQLKKSKPPTEPISLSLSEEVDPDDDANKSEYGSYEELIGGVVQYEVLKALNQKYQQSEVEITMLKGALSRSESALNDLQVELEATKTDMEMKNACLEETKAKILHLESQVLELETRLSDSHCKAEMLTEALKQAHEKLGGSTEDEATISSALDLERQKVAVLLERISVHHKDGFDGQNEIIKLQYVLSEAERKHYMEKEQLIMQWDSRFKQMEINSRQREDEMNELHHALVRDMQCHINNSQVGIEEREARIHSLNKELDGMKLRHDMVVAEKDGLNARIQSLLAELRCRDIHIKELAAGTASSQEYEDKSSSRVQELENEVEMQKALIIDGAEKKREAIRQLCFSLEHYRTGYNELREVFLRHN
ncbi:hypothetical protein SAY87_007923 [Trapa incisa]|uniref:NAB domain-containing protein n=1 Tax=Trapa incisa TaxID=236973 RepID=A0AAN7KL95_9MYRT|nr:hypothetical protein SAY87_007923 [Trapa incisa]